MNELFDFVRIEDGPGPNGFTASLYWDRQKREYFTKSSSVEHDRILALGTLWRKYGGEIIKHIVEANERHKAETSSETCNAMELIAWRLGGIKETLQVLERQLGDLLRQPEPSKDMQFWSEKFFKKKGEI